MALKYTSDAIKGWKKKAEGKMLTRGAVMGRGWKSPLGKKKSLWEEKRGKVADLD